MASGEEDQSQKTEEPTQKRLEDAFKKGQVVTSREVMNLFMLTAFLLLLWWVAPFLSERMLRIMAAFITRPHDIPVHGFEAWRTTFVHTVADVFQYLMIPLVIGIVAAFAGSLVQNRPHMSWEPVKPKLEKISLIKGLKRLFSLRSIVEFVKGIFKITLVGAIAVMVVWGDIERLGELMTYDFAALLGYMSTLSVRIVAAVCAVMLLIAFMDYAYQRYEYMKQMRMTQQEVKDEYKQLEGDPHVKQKIKQIRAERARQRMMAAVPTADVVVTNPTHYAIALKYESGDMEAPTVVAKGQDKVAQRIREVATEHKVPIVSNPPLARALHATVEINQPIPFKYYHAVAEIITYVYRLKGKLKGNGPATYRPNPALLPEEDR